MKFFFAAINFKKIKDEYSERFAEISTNVKSGFSKLRHIIIKRVPMLQSNNQ
jgi:hypothetical protein